MKVSRSGPSRRRSVAVTAAATSAVLLLGGCGSSAPGVAAQVGDDRISDEQVDEFALVLCAIGAPAGSAPSMPSGEARHRAMGYLLVNELAEDIADVEGVASENVAAAQRQARQQAAGLPEELRETFRELAVDSVRVQQAIVELGRQSLIAQGEPAGQITAEAANSEGARLLQEYARAADISVDPRYGTMVDGVLQPTDGSLSVPVSDLAVQAQPGGQAAGSLPPSQMCG